jgi:hypothetical protein
MPALFAASKMATMVGSSGRPTGDSRVTDWAVATTARSAAAANVATTGDLGMGEKPPERGWLGTGVLRVRE